ncbi:MAG: hypothetical protein PHI97_21670 [Desulfobulbus sp.]|nr:hypothetical protein [Desulfobulbus sp.]
MKLKNYAALALFAFSCFGLLITPRLAAAHCDTLDGPVIKDARLAGSSTFRVDFRTKFMGNRDKKQG